MRYYVNGDMNLPFAYRKATQALNFFARKSSGRINKLKALKLVFFADRYHLRKYGRAITNDRYLAMNYGPVPSGTKDLAEQSEFLGELEKQYSGRFIRPSREDVHALESIDEVETSVFSQSDLEALEYAWQKFGAADGFRLAELTHEYPEWRKHEAALKSGETTRALMAYDDFLEDPPTGVEPCFALSDEERECRKEMLEEAFHFEAKWR
jgi:uncharacterized phage-associated protein